MAVLALYEEGGFDIAEDFRELPDHIAAELEFLYLLLFREARGADAMASRSDGGDGRGSSGSGSSDEHLGRWVGPFTEAVERTRAQAFYRELATLTEALRGDESRQGGRAMETLNAAELLSALGHESRLAVFRLLVEAGAEGMNASAIGERVGLAPPTLSFHLAHLSRVGLIRAGRRSATSTTPPTTP